MNDEARSKLTLLIADDEQENVKAYTRALRGYHIVQASRGDEALQLLAEHQVDLIVTDQRMPGLSGALLLQRARAVNPNVRRVVVSATAQPEELLEAINRGEVERYLVKPVEPESLRQIVDGLAEEYLRVVAQRQRIVELQDQLEALRRQDALPDEAELLERVELELLRARRYRRPLSFLVFDPAPTAVDVAKLRDRLRELDIALCVGSRLLIALPEADRAGALALWERLRGVVPNREPKLLVCPDDGDNLQTLLLAVPSRYFV